MVRVIAKTGTSISKGGTYASLVRGCLVGASLHMLGWGRMLGWGLTAHIMRSIHVHLISLKRSRSRR